MRIPISIAITLYSCLVSCNKELEYSAPSEVTLNKDINDMTKSLYTTAELTDIFLRSDISRSDLDLALHKFFIFSFDSKLKGLVEGHDHDLLLVEWGMGSNYIYNDPIDTRKYNDENFPDFDIHNGSYLSLTRQVIDNPLSDEQGGYAMICLTFLFSGDTPTQDGNKWFDLSEDSIDGLKDYINEIKLKHLQGKVLTKVTLHIDQV